MMWQMISDWFFSLGAQYGVDPLVFGGIYVGAIPFFSASIAWLVKNFRCGRSIILPAMSAVFFFISAYIYLIFAGKNVPVWVYIVVVALIAVGAFSTIRKVQKQVKQA